MAAKTGQSSLGMAGSTSGEDGPESSGTSGEEDESDGDCYGDYCGGNNCQCVGAGPGEDGIVVEAEAGASTESGPGTDLSSPGSECDISRCGDDEWCPQCWNAPQLTGKAVTGIGNVAIQCAWL